MSHRRLTIPFDVSAIDSISLSYARIHSIGTQRTQPNRYIVIREGAISINNELLSQAC